MLDKQTHVLLQLCIIVTMKNNQPKAIQIKGKQFYHIWTSQYSIIGDISNPSSVKY